MAGQRIFRELLASGLPKCTEEGCMRPGLYNGMHRKDGSRIYKAHCAGHHQQRYGMEGGHRMSRKDYCENIDGRLGHVCTTTIIDPKWELEGDHINNKHTGKENNVDSNIQTLCACCHRVLTRLFGHLTSTPYIKRLFNENAKMMTYKSMTDRLRRTQERDAASKARADRKAIREARYLPKLVAK